MNILDLPCEIKLLIFESIPDIPTLYSLITTCKDFNETFKFGANKKSILNTVCLNEIYKYHYADAAYIRLFNSLLEEDESDFDPDPSEPIYALGVYLEVLKGKRNFIDGGPKFINEFDESLINHHLAIRKLAKIYIDYTLNLEGLDLGIITPTYDQYIHKNPTIQPHPTEYETPFLHKSQRIPNSDKSSRPRNYTLDAPATFTEFTRICSAIYRARAWLVLLRQKRKYKNHRQKLFNIDLVVEKMMNLSGFWNTVASYSIMKTFATELTSLLFLSNLKETQKGKIGKIWLHYEDSTDRTEMSTPCPLFPDDRDWSEPTDVARFLFCGKDLPSAATVYDFIRNPADSLWALREICNVDDDDEPPELSFEVISNIPTSNCDQVWLSLDRIYQSWNKSSGTRYNEEEDIENDPNGLYLTYPQEIPVKRLAVEKLWLTNSKRVGRDNWTQMESVLSENCVWDDWRLEEWGLHYPIFRFSAVNNSKKRQKSSSKTRQIFAKRRRF